MGRTGDGYWSESFRMATMSSTEAAWATAFGCVTRSPNQFVTVISAMCSPLPDQFGDCNSAVGRIVPQDTGVVPRVGPVAQALMPVAAETLVSALGSRLMPIFPARVSVTPLPRPG